jgi:hypothetical protein
MARSAETGAPTRAAAPGAKEILRGLHGEFRTIFRGMRLPGFPSDGVAVGQTKVHQTTGPVWTQNTRIQQKPGVRPTYEKYTDRVPVGEGVELTVALLEVVLPEDLIGAIGEWELENQAAVGALVAVLDERIAQEQLAQDLVILDRDSDGSYRGADHVARVREFPPTSSVFPTDRIALRRLRALSLSDKQAVASGARWYLKAAQAGPTPDAIVFLWIALEALAKPPFGSRLTAAQRRLSDVRWVEQAVERAGRNPGDLTPSVGRLHGLRAAVVHGGLEAPEDLRQGFYTLEAIARLLLRDRLGVRTSFPLRPNASNWIPPLRQLAALGHQFPRTHMGYPGPSEPG